MHISRPGGQALAVWVGGLLLVGVYNPPNEHKAEFLELLNSRLAEYSKNPFLFVGDWNLTPSENSFVDVFCASVVAAPVPGPQPLQPNPVYVPSASISMLDLIDSAASDPTMGLGALEPHVQDAHPDMDESTWLPTRWDANRCVDYAVTNLPNHPVTACLSSQRLSDHKILKLHCDKCLPDVKGFMLRKSDRHSKPDGISLHEQRSHLDAAWKACACALSYAGIRR